MMTIGVRFLSRAPSKASFVTKQSKSKLPKPHFKSSDQNTSSNNQTRAPFGFGEFSKLRTITKDEVKKSAAPKTITSFDDLMLFPSVRDAMVQEIRSEYSLRNPNIASKDDLKIIPTAVQTSSIRTLAKSRLYQVKKQEQKIRDGKINLEDYTKPDPEAISHLQNKLKIFTIAAETGSGKTWAYLGPLLSKLKQEELEAYKVSPETYKKFKARTGARSVVLLPTSELVDQVYKTLCNVNSIQLGDFLNPKLKRDEETQKFFQLPDQSDTLNMKFFKWSQGEKHFNLFDSLKTPGGVDVLITTPGKLETISKLRSVGNAWKYFHNVETIVFDEADTLLEPSWLGLSITCMEKISNVKDIIFVSATIPKRFSKTLKDLFPGENDIISVVTNRLHKIPKKIEVRILDAQHSPFNGSKIRCLAQTLYAIQKDGTEGGMIKRAIIFVNEKDDVIPVRDSLIKLTQNSEDIICLSGKDTLEERLKKIEPFVKPSEESNTPQLKVLITTDMLSRGMNFIGVKNVIIFDLPDNSTDLVHRIGRTGRMRQLGRVFIIVDKKTRKSWIKGLPKVVKNEVSIA